VSTQIQIRRDSEANWTSVNPILADGEIGFDVTSNRFKVGNGVDAWSDIEFSGSSLATGDQPTAPNDGEQWFNPSDGYLYIWYDNDGNGTWVAVGGTA
jgi:hypothetical protein